MARKFRRRIAFVSPIDPSLHFVLFLIMALFLVIAVAAVMMKTGESARALFVCPKITQAQLADKIRDCPTPYSVKIVQDKNKCPVPTCILTK